MCPVWEESDSRLAKICPMLFGCEKKGEATQNSAFLLCCLYMFIIGVAQAYGRGDVEMLALLFCQQGMLSKASSLFCK